MRDHPRAFGWKALGAVCVMQCFAGLFGSSATATAPRTVGAAFRAVCGTLICFVGVAHTARHGRKTWHSDHDPARLDAAFRARTRVHETVHRPHFFKDAALIALIFIDWHNVSLTFAGESAPGWSGSSGSVYRSGASGTSMEPSRYLVGPSALGIISHSKISFGSHSVAQAFGISTTPEIWP